MIKKNLIFQFLHHLLIHPPAPLPTRKILPSPNFPKTNNKKGSKYKSYKFDKKETKTKVIETKPNNLDNYLSDITKLEQTLSKKKKKQKKNKDKGSFVEKIVITDEEKEDFEKVLLMKN